MTAITRTNIAAGPNSGIVAFVELVDSEEPVFDGAVDPVDGGVLDAVAAKVDGAIARIATRVKTLNSALIDFDFIVISDNLYFIKTLQFLFYQ